MSETSNEVSNFNGLRPVPYTEDDYCAGVPCFWLSPDNEFVPVIPLMMSGRCPFDGSRVITFKFSNGYRSHKSIGGCELVPTLWRFKAHV